MIIIDKQRPDLNANFLVEEQIFNGKKYRISHNYAPEMDIDDKRIAISKFHEDEINKYEEIHGLHLYQGKISSFILFQDKKGSSHGGKYFEDELHYYDEVMIDFEQLVNYSKSEFTLKALSIIDEMKNIAKKVGNSKNAI